jgi:hypothetical protein
MRGIVLIALLLPGCAVPELRNDHDQIRCALLELYTNQIVDNLIRASNGLPIIQVDYTNAQGTVTIQETGMLSGAKSTTYATAVSVVKTFMGSLTGQNTNQVTLVGTPVTNHNEVYSAYLEFLTLPGSLLVSDTLPPTECVHLLRKCDGKYYWIPIEYRREFLRLALLTTAQRGQSLLPPDEFFSVAAQRVEGEIEGPRGTRLVTIVLDKAIPNDTGYFTLGSTEGEKTTEVREYDFNKYTDARGFQPDPTDRLTIKLLPDEIDAFKNLLPKPATVLLNHRRPKPPNTDDLLQRANIQLQQIQFNQMRQATGP